SANLGLLCALKLPPFATSHRGLPGVVCAQCSRVSPTESKLRSRIGLQGGTEAALQRTEPGVEVLPLLQTVAKYGFSHLFGACRAHCAGILVEAQAALFERQAAVVEQPTHFAFSVLDHRLVNDTVDPAGQHLVEVGHERDVVAVVAAEVVEVV